MSAPVRLLTIYRFRPGFAVAARRARSGRRFDDRQQTILAQMQAQVILGEQQLAGVERSGFGAQVLDRMAAADVLLIARALKWVSTVLGKPTAWAKRATVAAVLWPKSLRASLATASV